MAELELIRRDLDQVAATSWALQTLLVCLISRLDNQEPRITGLLRNAVDDAANLTEQIAVMGGQDSMRCAAAIKVLEEVRLAVQGQDQLRQGL
ncbi:hypothetical protein [Microvirga sp. VF16]|uniref:hypothetical protein n=1 Tax=Microvirga sp. VF16 TaxID=2807101 RepID=UPI00193CDDB4|nr:hypothetical protein [Microvirga sp. VF16]QRM34371.1 hypothetical protein JO965_34765 [Microvirga sp. VF16]